MRAGESVKQLLIRELDRRASDPCAPHLRAYYRQCAERLRSRGSGPLPAWAKDFAREWRIT